MDAPLGLRVSGLGPHEKVVVRTEAKGADGKRWVASTTFVADADGVVDPARESPLAGSYRGVHANGLLWSMGPERGPRQDVSFPSPSMAMTLTVSAGGRVLATRTLTRTFLAPRVTVRRLTVRRDGLYGLYYAPPHQHGPRPAVLAFGGSEGGVETGAEAALLASHGFPSLALAYFREPGLPQTLDRVPLEYFARALRWLGRQPGVDPHRLVIDGVSRGSEAAQLVAVLWPALVDAVVALVPADVVIGAYPGCRLEGPAWTLGGRALPYQCHSGLAGASATAAIPAQRIRGPVLLACGGFDEVWPSCPMAREIVRRRGSGRTTLLAFPAGGHGVGDVIPNFPIRDGYPIAGATPQANPVAREELWPRILCFVASTPKGR